MADPLFRLRSDHQPSGDQPAAIAGLVRYLTEGRRDAVLLGVTGSGKTFTMAQVIAQLGRPALVMAPNKTLAAQLYGEFQELFPDNAVEYFVSYYDYYQPEAYVPSSDTYIEKDATINEAIDRMRNSATSSLLSRRDVILVASVSCIYGLGSPEHYAEMSVTLKKGQTLDRDELLHALAAIQYARNNLDFSRGTVRVRGDVVEIFPAYAEDRVIRVELFGDEIDALLEVDPLRGEILAHKDEVTIFPASHYVTPADRLRTACDQIEVELEQRLTELKEKHKLLEAQRLEQRTRYDLELLRATGFCAGIENYSRFLDGRAPGQPPATLLNYFPPDFLLFLDESHVTVPQIGGMYWGDRSRKETLVQFGFRLPSALDNRPLKFAEFEALRKQAVYVSATPGTKELQAAGPAIVEQVIRPTGLVDPVVEVRPAAGQVDDLLSEIKKVVAAQGRVLVTTLTKRMAEELTDYYRDLEVKVKYLHSDIETIERTQLLRDLRLGVFDVLVGINLLREGLDLPEVMLVAVLDADKEGFLRSESSLIQTCGRAARNVLGRVLLYADQTTQSMRRAMGEMERRRGKQLDYNAQHGITPQTIKKSIREILESPAEADYVTVPLQGPALLGPTPGKKAAKAAMAAGKAPFKDRRELLAHIEGLRETMRAAARELRFEEAAKLRDEVFRMEKLDLEMR